MVCIIYIYIYIYVYILFICNLQGHGQDFLSKFSKGILCSLSVSVQLKASDEHLARVLTAYPENCARKSDLFFVTDPEGPGTLLSRNWGFKTILMALSA